MLLENKMEPQSKLSFGVLIARVLSIGICICGLTVGSTESGKAGKKETDLFAKPQVYRIEINVGAVDTESLKNSPRKYVPATVRIDGTTYKNVGVHLKGSTGSFRDIDDKPGLTLNFAKFDSGAGLGELEKIHLNNSVEDPSFLNEYIGSELFREAGVPAARVKFALVTLNRKSRGLYVVKEGFSEKFLAKYFSIPDGDLYDTDWGHDIDREMKNHASKAKSRISHAFQATLEAVKELDAEKRWESLNVSVDMPLFLNFMATEMILSHRDGYSMAKNNFWIYVNPENGRMVFLPSGMDQLFGKADLPWNGNMAGIVSQAVMKTPVAEHEFKDAIKRLLPQLLAAENVDKLMKEALLALQNGVSRREFTLIKLEADALKERIAERRGFLLEEMRQPEPAPLQFKGSIAKLQNWEAIDPPINGKMEIVPAKASSDGYLHIESKGETIASWRTQAFLNPGKYTFRAKVSCRDVQDLPYGKASGARLRIIGLSRSSAEGYKQSEWQTLELPFEVRSMMERVDFVAELRASAGEAWFDRGTMEVIKN
jgi:spore coat protein H